MSNCVALKSKYYEEAEKMLKEQDLLGFVSKISNAILLAEGDQELMAKATYLQVRGLFQFNQYQKALESMDEALKYNNGLMATRLKIIKGIIKGYMGEIPESLEIFKSLIPETKDTVELLDLYLNIIWVHLTPGKNHPLRDLDEVKKYLDLVQEHLDLLPNPQKWRFYNNYSIYYFYQGTYDKAIKILEKSTGLCSDDVLPDLYVNLAELYLQSDESGIAGCVYDYLEKAELIASQQKNYLALGYIFYTKAMTELREDQLFSALDTLYLSFEYFKNAEAHSQACESLLKINEIMDDYKNNRLKALKANLKERLKDTTYFNKIS